MKVKQNNSKGITLVALVVTIIVLIILAGVSISLVLGENGIITKSKQAKQETLNAQVAEQEQLNEAVSYLENMGKNEQKPQVEYAPYDNPYIPTGFEPTGEGTWNNGYVIKETLTGNEFVWVPCVLEQSKVKQTDTVVTFKKILPQTEESTDPYYMYNASTNSTITEEESSASEIETSVGKYGGFYIARYEAGGDESAPEGADETAKPMSQKEKTTWYAISRTNAIIWAKRMVDEQTTGVKSALISGAAWDTTLQWMVNASENAAKEPNSGYDIDSTGNGWYEKDYITTTGQYSINNIYDMAGNVAEWTTENLISEDYSYGVARGGYYSDIGSEYPAAYRHGERDTVENKVGIRVVLYK